MKDEAYAIKITVHPKPNGETRYQAKTFSGVCISDSPKNAQECVIDSTLQAFNKGGVKITREEVTIKQCTLYKDFILKTK